MQPYKYQPLHDSLLDYRVLIIHPAEETSSRLCISLLPCNINEHPEYIALSYTWGTNVPTHAIVVVALDTVADGTSTTVEGEILVTEYLAQALQQQRQASKHTWLWADQLCIDQQNIPERSAQVRIMNLIFEKAHRVNCWLGLEPFGVNNGKAAWKKLKDIVDHVQKCLDAVDPSSEIIMERVNIYEVGILTPHGEIVDRQIWEAIFVLLQNPWWHRTWIMPEVLRHKNPCIIFHDSALELWSMSSALLFVWQRLWQVLGYKNQLTINFPFVIQFVAAQERDRRLIELSTLQSETLQCPLRLTAVLEATRASMATDPKDKVFAAIACLSNVEESSLLVPDYSSSIRTVYGRVVEYMIRTLNNLMVFATVEPRPVGMSADLPSWIPDWRNTGVHYPGQSLCGLRSIYNASGGTKARVWIDKEYAELKVAGLFVDIIHVVGTDCADTIEEPFSYRMLAFFAVIREWYTMVISVLGHMYRTGIPTLHAFRITMTMDCTMPLWTRGHTPPVDFMAIESADLNKSLNDGSGSLFLALASIHRFFISQDGYMGLCPRNTQQGDKIFILLGGAMPAVLRPVPGGYNLVGFAYVHGLMDGEAMVGVETGQYKLQEDITLL